MKTSIRAALAFEAAIDAVDVFVRPSLRVAVVLVKVVGITLGLAAILVLGVILFVGSWAVELAFRAVGRGEYYPDGEERTEAGPDRVEDRERGPL